MPQPPKSKQFDDIYFSAEDGLAETQHVFLDGNNLPEAWHDQERFVIFETGFGTGLNFISVWKLFENSAKNGQKLDFISVEKYPLKPDFILKSLSHWSDFSEGRLETLTRLHPLLAPGYHRAQISEDITLTLIFDDIAEALPTVKGPIDCWFLDGFRPATNPEMWSAQLYKEMARLSSDHASFATFTAAGDVRRGIQEVGFDVQKIPGFGKKREMLVGTYKGRTS